MDEQLAHGLADCRPALIYEQRRVLKQAREEMKQLVNREGDGQTQLPIPNNGGQSVFTEQEAAAYLKMTPLMLARRRRRGKIGSLKDGHYIRYTLEHLLEYQRSSHRRTLSSVEDMDPDMLIGALRKQLRSRK